MVVNKFTTCAKMVDEPREKYAVRKMYKKEMN